VYLPYYGEKETPRQFPMHEYEIELQGYDREIGLSFSVWITIHAQTPEAARQFALEEAIRQKLPVAVVATVRFRQNLPENTLGTVVHTSHRHYHEESG